MSNKNSSLHDSAAAIFQSTAIISLGTFFSRILGFIRDIILAKVVGTGILADAFFVAFRIPNLLRDLMGEGATNSAVVPVLTEYVHKKDLKQTRQLVNVVGVCFLGILSGVCLLGIFLSPWIVALIAPGFRDDPNKLALTIQLTKWLFPYLILIGLTAFSMGVLYTFRSFFWPAVSPCLLNIAMIIGVVAASYYWKNPTWGLVFGVLAGGLLQLSVQLWALKKIGIKLKWPKNLTHPGVKQIGTLLLPRIFGSGVYQLNVFIDTMCASFSQVVGVGGISAIYYANRLIQFPQGIFGVALASAVLPTMSSLVSQGDISGLRKTILFSLKNIFLVMLPVSIVSIILAYPLVQLLFERGVFDHTSTAMTAQAMQWFAPGLFWYGAMRIVVTAFHAQQDTMTPVKVASLCLVLNAVLNFSLMGSMKIGGIALASSISVFVNFAVLFMVLDKRLGGLRKEIVKFLFKLVIPASVMGASIVLGYRYLEIPILVIKLALLILNGFIVFFGLCRVLGVSEVKKVFAQLAAKLKLSS